MRVAFLTSAWGPADGLLGRNVQALARAVAELGPSVEILGSGPGAGMLRRHEGAFDVLHVHGRPAPPVALAAQQASARLVFTPHYYAREPHKLRQLAQGRSTRLDRQLLAGASAVVCASQCEALQLRRHAPHAAVYVIPHGVDGASIARARSLPVDGRVIVTADSLTHWTGVHRIISALPALSPSYRLVVIGRGRGRGRLEAHAEYLRVSDRVRFTGPAEEGYLHRWLRTASVVAMLQEESLWGGMLLAAGSAGAPVVASDIPAYREAAALEGRDDITFVSRRASPFAVAEALRDQALAGSRPRPDLVPTWEDMAEQTVAVYQDVLAPRVAA